MSSVPPTSPLGGPLNPLVTGQAQAAPPVAPVVAQAQVAGAVQTLTQQAVEAALADAAIRQSGMGALLADLAPALASPNLSPTLKQALARLATFGLRSDAAPDAAALKAAVARSGLFLEAQLAQTPASPPNDMKAALLVLQQALATAGATGGGRAAKASTPPPTRGAAISAQAAQAAALRGDEPAPHELAVLRDETDQALARLTLHQLDSLPDPARGARWTFELPLLTPQGATVAQFEVERYPPEEMAGREHPEPAWRARFALDAPPLGPVHVHLRLRDGRRGAVLWVQEAGALALLREEADRLAAALGGEVTLRPGPPPAPAAEQAPAPGRLVDRSS